jgi:AAA domain-containing protein
MVATRRPTARPARRKSPRRDRSVAAVPDRPKITVNAEELQDFNDSVNWCIFGDSGVGKTTFASFAPRGYILSTERGVIAAKRVGSTAKLLRAPTWPHVEASIDWADEHLTSDDWLIVDSASKMQELLIQWWLGVQHDENAARDLDIPQLQDYPKWQRMYMRFVMHIIDAPYNSIFIATSMHKEDPEGDPIVLPNIVGKDYAIANNFCAEMDIVSCLRVQKRENIDDPRQAIITNDTFPPYFGKDRYRALPRWETINDGDFDVIVDMIEDILTVPADVRKAAKTETA